MSVLYLAVVRSIIQEPQNDICPKGLLIATKHNKTTLCGTINMLDSRTGLRKDIGLYIAMILRLLLWSQRRTISSRFLSNIDTSLCRLV